MNRTGRVVNIIIIIGFFCTLYWVEISSWGSQAVARYNAGYGTFDMKDYDMNSVELVLGNMEEEGFRIYYHYYIGDYLFIIFFGLTQVMISKKTCKGKGVLPINRGIYKFSIAAIIIRGIADFIENTLLVITLIQYPDTNRILITTATISTQVKLYCIMVWGASILLSIIIKCIENIRKLSKGRKKTYGKAQR